MLQQLQMLIVDVSIMEKSILPKITFFEHEIGFVWIGLFFCLNGLIFQDQKMCDCLATYMSKHIYIVIQS